MTTRDKAGTQMWGPDSVRDRYEQDHAFRTLVDTLWACIERAEYTPSEIRQAAMLAQILYEERRPPKPIIFTRQDVIDRKV